MAHTICKKCGLSFGVSTKEKWTVEACNGDDPTCVLNDGVKAKDLSLINNVDKKIEMAELKRCAGCNKMVKNPCEDGFASLGCKNAYFKLIKLFDWLKGLRGV